jgi:hypothetical protein
MEYRYTTKFYIGKMKFKLRKSMASGRGKYDPAYIIYSRGNACNQIGISKDKYSWSIYDYLMMLSQQEYFDLDIGGVY